MLCEGGMFSLSMKQCLRKHIVLDKALVYNGVLLPCLDKEQPTASPTECFKLPCVRIVLY